VLAGQRRPSLRKGKSEETSPETRDRKPSRDTNDHGIDGVA
jgi:hypothetical protein